MHSSKEMPDLSNAKVTDLIRKFALPAIIPMMILLVSKAKHWHQPTHTGIQLSRFLHSGGEPVSHPSSHSAILRQRSA